MVGNGASSYIFMLVEVIQISHGNAKYLTIFDFDLMKDFFLKEFTKKLKQKMVFIR